LETIGTLISPDSGWFGNVVRSFSSGGTHYGWQDNVAVAFEKLRKD